MKIIKNKNKTITTPNRYGLFNIKTFFVYFYSSPILTIRNIDY